MNNNQKGSLSELIYIVGYNENSIRLYNTSPKKECTYLIAKEGEVIPSGINAIYSDPSLTISTAMLKSNLRVIINTECDEECLTILRAVSFSINQLVTLAADEDRDTLIRELYTGTRIFAIGNGAKKEDFEKIENESFGCIRYISPSLECAYDFINRYPIARFIPREKILPDTTIDKDFDINVIMIGFCELNSDILISSIANNQFLSYGKDGTLSPKLVKYFILGEGLDNSIKDKIPAFRYERELFSKYKVGKICGDDYLELPALPASVDFFDVKCDTGALLDKISALQVDKSSLTLFIIDTGKEEENLALAGAITDAGLCQADTLFARVDACECGFHTYGGISQLYNTERILSDKIFGMAIERNRIYTLESEYLKDIADGHFDGSFDDIIALADHKWYTKRTVSEHRSNIYAVLSIRSKLNLLGLDYAEDDAAPLSPMVYDELYTRGEIEYLPNISVLGRRIPAGMTYEFTDTVRGMLAHQEHYRWNSFMISEGYIPAGISDIVEGKNKDGNFTNGKNNELRLHGNITTADGLIKYRQLIATRDGCDELMRDVICYDYQLMDDAVWLIMKNGYKLIKRRG